MEIISCSHVNFTYPGCEEEVLKDVSFSIRRSEFVVLCGKSGCGKSTLLRHLKKNLMPYGKLDGHILYCGEEVENLDDRVSASQIGFVQQNPDNQIVTDKVWHELAFGLESLGLDNRVMKQRVAEMASFFGIQTWFRKNVSELSGGEQQRLALGKILLRQPAILLLDEPTKGLDPFFKRTLAGIFKRLCRNGITILMVTHDIEFCAEHADRCALFFDGEIVSCGTPKEFFSGNSFYTTAANRVAGQWFPDAVTWEEVASRCGGAMTSAR